MASVPEPYSENLSCNTAPNFAVSVFMPTYLGYLPTAIGMSRRSCSRLASLDKCRNLLDAFMKRRISSGFISESFYGCSNSEATSRRLLGQPRSRKQGPRGWNWAEMPRATFVSFFVYFREVCQSVLGADRAITLIGAFQKKTNAHGGEYQKYEVTTTDINGKWPAIIPKPNFRRQYEHYKQYDRDKRS